MTASLPTPVAAYLEANNQHDVERMIAAFDPTAVVKDAELEDELRDPAAIRRWVEETTARYHPIVEVLRVSRVSGTRDEVTEVEGRVSGDFPGSPAELRYAFTLRDGRISHLEISA